MGRDKKNENAQERHTKWVYYEAKLPAWKALSSSAQAAYMHVKVRCFPGKKDKPGANNNGRVRMSARDLAAEMGVTPPTAQTALADLQAKGWLVCTKRHQKGVEGVASKPEWRLTIVLTYRGNIGVSPTAEPRNWQEGHDYPVIEYAGSKKPGHAPGNSERFRSQAGKRRNVVVKFPA